VTMTTKLGQTPGAGYTPASMEQLSLLLRLRTLGGGRIAVWSSYSIDMDSESGRPDSNFMIPHRVRLPFLSLESIEHLDSDACDKYRGLNSAFLVIDLEKNLIPCVIIVKPMTPSGCFLLAI